MDVGDSYERVNMNAEMQEKALRWQDEVMTMSKQITAAEGEYQDACTIRLERKHKLDELKGKLKQLCDRGPFGVEDNQPTLFDNLPDEDDEDDSTSVRELKVPNRICLLLEKAGIRSVERLRQVIDGLDETYPDGLEGVAGIDVDARNRIISQLIDDDEDKEDDAPATVAYTTPVSESKADTVKLPSSKVTIKLSVDVEDWEAGEELEASIMPTGQAVVSRGAEDDDALLEAGEFSIVG